MLSPLEVLYEADLPAFALPSDLERLYGRIGFPRRVLYSNFVSSVDGAVTLGSQPNAGSAISGKYPADRFVMGLLRACADAVLLGAGTLRGSPGHVWTPSYVCREMSDSFSALRRNLGRTAEPRLVLITAGGQIDLSHPAVVRGALVVTTAAGAKAIGQNLPSASELVVVAAEETLDLERVVGELRNRGYEALLTEGGPHLMGGLIGRRLLDEMFLTVSPLVAGRAGERRLGMVEGVELLPMTELESHLLSARRHGDYLFLRYGLSRV